jgi:hypothetical protein
MVSPELERLTNGSDNLRFHAELVRESTSKIANASLAVTYDVGYFADMIEHVATGEQQDSNQAKAGPQISVSYDRQGIRRQNRKQSYHTHKESDCRDNSHVIDWADERWFCTFRKMSADPCVELVGR